MVHYRGDFSKSQTNKDLGIVSEALLGIGLGAGLASIVLYFDEIILPGRPAYSLPLKFASSYISLLVALLVMVSGFVLMRVDKYLGSLVVVFGTISVAGQWWSGFLAAIILIIVFVNIVGRIGIFASLLASVFFVLRALGMMWNIIGSGIIMGQTISAMILGVIIALIYFIIPRGIEVQKKNKSKPLQTNNSHKHVGLVLLLVAYLIAIMGILVPHLRYGFNKIVSYDTYYNIRFCDALRKGDYMKALFSWQRPLYGILVTGTAALVNCSAWFFDVIVPLVGLVLLATFLWLIIRKETSSNLIAGIAAVIGTSYWAPFFLYAGLQTNLLALPAAISLPYLLLKRKDTKASMIVSAFLGLWHPWTLAYYTVAILIAARFTPSQELKELLRNIAYGLMPGWLSYGFVAFVSSKALVINVAQSGVLVSKPFLQNIGIFFWGTSMRPDVFVPLVMYLISIWALRRKIIPLWVFAPSLLGFLSPLLPNARLIVRFLVDAPFPLLLALVLSRERPAYWAAAVMSAILVYSYFLGSLKPVVYPPK
ncbi:hypothetical protein PYJP_00150 [Pyrofollis japonicus]|nr:hypothetical protein PYJP_00150 [Pyrofollis japonicus]